MDLSITRSWIRKAFTQLSTATRANAINSRSPANTFRSLRRSIQINITVIKAVIDLVFNPKFPDKSPPPLTSSIPGTNTPPTSTTRSPCLAIEVPETLFLDVARLGICTTDAVDLTAIYMLLLLYRQLVFSEVSLSARDSKGSASRRVAEAELITLKSEIWAIAPPRLGSCFIPEARKLDNLSASSSERRDKERPRIRSSKSERERWRKGVRDVALHILARSKDVEWRAEAASAQTASIPRLAAPGSVRPTRAPNTAMLRLVERWCESNLQFGSPLSILLREKLADEMLHMVMACYHNANYLPPLSNPTAMGGSVSRDSQVASRALNKVGLLQYLPSDTMVGWGLGMQTLDVEMKGIAERIAKLVRIHVDVYGVMYESESGLLIIEA